uniref:Uncharacterized protein n=1 Tax=Anguilla anguilla TaxID=7936 RepID=A0A0E9T9U7_ANGAN
MDRTQHLMPDSYTAIPFRPLCAF